MNTDEPTRWSSIGWQCALILNRLRNAAEIDQKRSEEQADAEKSADADRADDKEAMRGKLLHFR